MRIRQTRRDGVIVITVSNDQGRDVCHFHYSHSSRLNNIMCRLENEHGEWLFQDVSGYKWASGRTSDMEIVEVMEVAAPLLASELMDMEHKDGGFIPNGVDPAFRDADGCFTTPDKVYATVGLVSHSFDNMTPEDLCEYMPPDMAAHYKRQWMLYFAPEAVA